MKTVINVVLVLVALVLVVVTYNSIMAPIKFDKQKTVYDNAVIKRLKDIRTAQLEYRAQHDQAYTNNFDTLIDFIKTAKKPFVLKEGVLTDDQLASGLTEKKAMKIINKAKKTGNYREVEKKGLEKFRRDTLWVSVLDTAGFSKGFNPDSIRYVPNTNNAKFEMDTVITVTKSGMPVFLFQANVKNDVYLAGLNDKQAIINLNDEAKNLGRFPGLQVGSIEDGGNNNAGNWE
ncbi:MAG TPA: hypothetical protein PLK40_09690 [Bacteroidaceae bacterium]|nr:hypothetical protein [Bacteroidaceae bacterium]